MTNPMPHSTGRISDSTNLLLFRFMGRSDSQMGPRLKAPEEKPIEEIGRSFEISNRHALGNPAGLQISTAV